jgi:uridine kinase
MHHEFLEPTRQYADLIVGEETDLAAEVVAAQVFRLVQQSREAEL